MPLAIISKERAGAGIEATIAIRAVPVPLRAPGLVGCTIGVVTICAIRSRSRFPDNVGRFWLVVARLRSQCTTDQRASGEPDNAGCYSVTSGALVVAIVVMAIIASVTTITAAPPVTSLGGGQGA
jgi:hypothetical protein